MSRLSRRQFLIAATLFVFEASTIGETTVGRR